MTRQDRINETIAGLEVFGSGEDTGMDNLDNPSRYLLVEENVGSAKDEQSHWFSTFDTLEEAGAYHASQEFRQDWEIQFAVDLDTGTRHEPELKIVWST